MPLFFPIAVVGYLIGAVVAGAAGAAVLEYCQHGTHCKCCQRRRKQERLAEERLAEISAKLDEENWDEEE